MAKANLQDANAAYLTLVALYVLQGEFEERENEWRLIAKKGKDYLKSVGVQKPDALINEFTLKFMQ